MQRKIFTVGDSHSLRCFENHPAIADSTRLFGYNKLDGRTAYNLKRHEKRLKKILEPLREKHLIFVFGEVDVRIHIKYQHRQSWIPTDELIRNTADRYTGYVADLRALGYTIHVFNVVPTGDFNTPEAKQWRQKLGYPFLADRSERTRFTEGMGRLCENRVPGRYHCCGGRFPRGPQAGLETEDRFRHHNRNQEIKCPNHGPVQQRNAD